MAKTYSVGEVTRILRNYLDIRATLTGRGQQLHDNSYTARRKKTTEQPFGKDVRPWPFMEPKHAHPPIDGKARARAMEELHCVTIDLESAFPRISEDDQDLLLKYHINQSHTLDDLVLDKQKTSRSSMSQRVQRAVARLALEMNYAGRDA